jgi:hypothetical protein
MKTLLLILLCAFSFALRAQITVGLKAGLSPDVRPGTANVIVNREDPQNEFLFNSDVVHFTPTVGIQVRLDRHQKWFSAELLAYGWEQNYSVSYVMESESNATYKEQKYVIELPVSIGFTLNHLEIFSGFSISQTISDKTELHKINGYASSVSMRRYGWHTGVGIALSKFHIDLRYAQYFSNYGQHRSVNGCDLTLRNAPARLLASVSIKL